MNSPPFHRNLLLTKHLPFFIGKDQRQPLVGEILKILKKEISHKIHTGKIMLMEPDRPGCRMGDFQLYHPGKDGWSKWGQDRIFGLPDE